MLRIVSYNIHACRGTDRKFDPERIVSVLRSLNPDIVAIQELEDVPYAGMSLSEYFSQKLDLHGYQGSTLTRFDAPYGNLLLAKYQATSIVTHDISVPSAEPRGAIEADFLLGNAGLKVVATHLGLNGAQRKEQSERLQAIFTSPAADIEVLAGDFNEWRPFGAGLRPITSTFEFGSRNNTFPAKIPLIALDRIFVSPASLVAAHWVEKSPKSRRASDHLPLVCDLDIDLPEK